MKVNKTCSMCIANGICTKGLSSADWACITFTQNMVKNFTCTQQLKAEIAAIVNDFDTANDILDFAYAVKCRIERMRQLSAV